jgi:hypothetical protein
MSALQIQKQMLSLGSQAAQVFKRKAFGSVVWAGVFGPFSRAQQHKGSPVSLVIFHDPKYSEEEIWKWCSSNEESYWDVDPDKSKLERVWDREVDLVRIFAGTLRYEKDVEAILYAQTVYGNFNNPVLQRLRSSSLHKTQEYLKKIQESKALAVIASRLDDSSKHQYTRQIADMLAGNKDDPLYFSLVLHPRNLAENLANKSDRNISKESIERLWSLLQSGESHARKIISYATFAKDIRDEWKRPLSAGQLS